MNIFIFSYIHMCRSIYCDLSALVFSSQLFQTCPVETDMCFSVVFLKDKKLPSKITKKKSQKTNTKPAILLFFEFLNFARSFFFFLQDLFFKHENVLWLSSGTSPKAHTLKTCCLACLAFRRQGLAGISRSRGLALERLYKCEILAYALSFPVC